MTFSIVLLRNLRCLPAGSFLRLQVQEWRAMVRLSRLGGMLTFNVVRNRLWGLSMVIWVNC